MTNNTSKALRLRTMTILLVLAPIIAAGSAQAAANVNVSKTFGLEAGDWILVQATGFLPRGNITIAIDGTTAWQGVADANGAFTQSVQVPYQASPGYTKLTVTDNTNTVDLSIQIKGSLESFVETFQGLTPMMKAFVGMVIIALPAIIVFALWGWMRK